MRWSGQSVAEQDDGALLPAASVPGLVRTTTTPEFAGMTFYEVLAKSALSQVPATSAMPFRWTVNPYRGCSHACAYCLSPETPVLMADGTQRPIGELQAGDAVVGTVPEGDGGHRAQVTEVVDRWSTVKRAHRVLLTDGTTLTASADHRFLTPAGWKHVAGPDDDGLARPVLRAGDELVRLVGVVGVARVDDTGVEIPMVDITTGTGDFIADGVISHNCFARITHSYLELDTGIGFDSQVVVKTNVAERLAVELARPSWTREHVALGTNTDPYQRAEGRYRLMPGVIAALHRSGTPFSVLTKGTLLRRDLPLLAAAARDVPVGLGVSIAVWDEQLHRSLEPGTPSPRARLDLVRAARDAGLPCGVFLAPVLPHLTDSVEQLDAALADVAAAGATGVTVLPLHLRPGAREHFARWVGRHRPELVPAYRELYRRGAYLPREYREALTVRLGPLLERHGLAASSGGEQREGSWPRGSLPEVAPARVAAPEPVTLF